MTSGYKIDAFEGGLYGDEPAVEVTPEQYSELLLGEAVTIKRRVYRLGDARFRVRTKESDGRGK